MTDILEPFWTEEAKKIIEQNRQVLEQLKKRRKKNLFQKISLIQIREIKLSEKLILNSGDIILRPLKNLKSDWNLDLNHYGIVFGTTIDNKKLILEITSENNVGIVDMKTFLNGHTLRNISVERKPANRHFETIIKRAEELQHETYSWTHLNCRQFVNDCVYGKRESKAVQNIANIIVPFLDIVTAYLDFKLTFQINKDKKMFTEFSNKIKGVSNNIKQLK